MVVIHHNDPDGRCAAAIVNNCYKNSGRELVFIEASYDSVIDFNKIKLNEEVVIVDFSLQKPGDWEILLAITPFVTWIDHHKSAINIHPELSTLSGIRDISKSGCELTWEYCFKDLPMPKVVQHIGDYDTWKFKLNHTEDIFMAIKTQDHNPESKIWDEWLIVNDDEQEMIDDLNDNGRIIKAALYHLYSEIAHDGAYGIILNGYRCLACNAINTGSKVFTNIPNIRKTFDFLIVYKHSHKGFTVSVYTENPDLDASELCLKYGGGGHKGAAGFQCKELPWKTI